MKCRKAGLEMIKKIHKTILYKIKNKNNEWYFYED